MTKDNTNIAKQDHYHNLVIKHISVYNCKGCTSLYMVNNQLTCSAAEIREDNCSIVNRDAKWNNHTTI